MSDYRVRVTIRNNRILKAIEAKGFSSVQKFCDQYKLNYPGVNSIINGSREPLSEKGELKELVKEILDILNISLDKAFTEKQLKGFKKNSFTIEAKEFQLMQIAEIKKPLEISLMEKDIRTLIDTYVYSLPEKYKVVVKGLIYENRTLEDLGTELNVTRERIRQIFKRAVLRLRTSENFEKLIESGARDLFENTSFIKSPENNVNLKGEFKLREENKNEAAI